MLALFIAIFCFSLTSTKGNTSLFGDQGEHYGIDVSRPFEQDIQQAHLTYYHGYFCEEIQAFEPQNITDPRVLYDYLYEKNPHSFESPEEVLSVFHSVLALEIATSNERPLSYCLEQIKENRRQLHARQQDENRRRHEPSAQEFFVHIRQDIDNGIEP